MTYLAECEVCLPLFDPQNIIPALKKSVEFYPRKLKESVVNTALWSAEFTLAHAGAFASKKDMYNILGCFTRSLKNIVEALFALNELYPITDKHAIQLLSKTALSPKKLEEKVNAILSVEPTTIETNLKKYKRFICRSCYAHGQFISAEIRF
jgi:hypothetical protein